MIYYSPCASYSPPPPLQALTTLTCGKHEIVLCNDEDVSVLFHFASSFGIFLRLQIYVKSYVILLNSLTYLIYPSIL